LGHLIEVRAAVEDRVVALVTRRPAADLSAVRDVLERSEANLRESGEPGSLDLSFEAALAREAGNPLLAEMQRSVHHLWVEAWSECRIAPGDWRQFYVEHHAILKALERGDSEEARRLMAEHVDRTISKAVPASQEE
jgi:DNA-binding FadR family transcriptional regulator